MSRTSSREFRVGLVFVLALGGAMVLLARAGGGSGFLSRQQEIDVVFRDGQGIKQGSSVRVAGIDVGRVTSVDLAEVEGQLRARVRLSVPTALAARLRQDVKITIQSSITGQNCVNVVSSGKSSVALVPGQVILGVETSFFDPILEQVGLGPVERKHLSHMIAEVRQTVDSAAPRIRQAVASLQETAAGLKETVDSARPNVAATTANIEEISRRINAATPKIEAALARIETITTQAEGLVTDSRPQINASLANVKDLTATTLDVITKEREKISTILTGIDSARQRGEKVLYNAEIMTDQGAQILVRNRANIERSVANVRDATDWADQFVQKIYSNPFLISPLYKPKAEDMRTQQVIDTARLFLKGAKELTDNVKTLESMQAQTESPQRRQDMEALYKRCWALMEWMSQTEKQLAEGLRPQVQMRR